MSIVSLRDTDPSSVGPFRLLGRIGSGALGVIYLADRGVDGGDRVAVRVVREEFAGRPEFRLRFGQEVRASMTVQGDSVARIVAVDLDANPQWLATQYFPGPTLEDFVSTHGALPQGQVRLLALGLADAVQSLQAAGTIHRDLKPSNVILAPTGPKVIDAGFTHALDSASMVSAGASLVSAAWLAPEQITGTSETSAMDVFGWGQLVAFAALGRHPFGTGRAEALTWRVLNQPPDLRGLSPDLIGPVSAALSVDPNSRPTPDRLVDALNSMAGSTGDLPADLAANWNRQLFAEQSNPDQVLNTHAPVAVAAPVAAATPVVATTESAAPERAAVSNRNRAIAVVAAVAVVVALIAGGSRAWANHNSVVASPTPTPPPNSLSSSPQPSVSGSPLPANLPPAAAYTECAQARSAATAQFETATNALATGGDLATATAAAGALAAADTADISCLTAVAWPDSVSDSAQALIATRRAELAADTAAASATTPAAFLGIFQSASFVNSAEKATEATTRIRTVLQLSPLPDSTGSSAGTTFVTLQFIDGASCTGAKVTAHNTTANPFFEKTATVPVGVDQNVTFAVPTSLTKRMSFDMYCRLWPALDAVPAVVLQYSSAAAGGQPAVAGSGEPTGKAGSWCWAGTSSIHANIYVHGWVHDGSTPAVSLYADPTVSTVVDSTGQRWQDTYLGGLADQDSPLC